MVPRERSFFGALALVFYVGSAHLRVAPQRPLAWVALALGPLLLLAGWRKAGPPSLGPDWIAPSARRAGQACLTAVVLYGVAAAAPDTPSFLAARSLGIAVALTSASVAVSRIGELSGLGLTQGHRNDAAVVSGLLWLPAVGLGVVRATSTEARIDALAVDYAVVAASFGSLGISTVASWRVFVSRRFQLGVPERAAGALWLGVLCLAIGALAALMEVAPPEAIVPVAALCAAAAATSSAISQRPAVVARALRTTAAVTMLATPLMSVAVVAAYKAPTHAGVIVFFVTVVAVALGMFAPKLAERMAPERGRTKRVLDQAVVAAKAPEPRQAVVLALSAIRDGLGADNGPAALYRFATADRLTVDRAGYLHSEHGLVPTALVERVSREAERVVGTDTLRANELKEVALGSMITWLEDRGAGAAALVLDEDLPIGVLLWPAAGRTAPLAFDEVVALRSLADHLGFAAGAEARLEQSRERATEIERGLGAASKELRQMRSRLDREGGRLRASVERLARDARRATYSPAATMALGTAEALGASDDPLYVVHQPGGDPLGWAAILHLASRRRDELFFVVDCGRSEMHDPARWRHPADSPIEFVRGGTLVLLDAHVLPRDVQRIISTRTSPGTSVFAVVPESVFKERTSDAFDAHFSAIFGDRVLAPPALIDRAEDLRALALLQLSELGRRLRGRPFGLSLDAQQALGEHEWPCNELELEFVLLCAARITDGDVVSSEVLLDAMRHAGARFVRESKPTWRGGAVSR